MAGLVGWKPRSDITGGLAHARRVVRSFANTQLPCLADPRLFHGWVERQAPRDRRARVKNVIEEVAANSVDKASRLKA
eukprot:365707-Chlamydomonas_euryale.AAC.22